MGRRDDTQIGGPLGTPPETQWTAILRYAQTQNDEFRREFLASLFQRYWKPVYSFLRKQGRSNEEAKDLTQGFFLEVVFGRDLVSLADRARGRFRNFLITALRNFVVGQDRRAAARKRHPPGRLLSFNWPDEGPALEPVAGGTPEDVFLHEWASEMLDEVLDEVEARCRQEGQQAHWEVFQQWVLAPILAGAEPGPIERICAGLGIADRKTAWNMAETVKRSFRRALRRRIRPLVASEEEVDEELSDILQILSQRAQNSGTGGASLTADGLRGPGGSQGPGRPPEQSTT